MSATSAGGAVRSRPTPIRAARRAVPAFRPGPSQSSPILGTVGRTLATLVVLLLLASPTLAQQTGAVAGRVADAADAPLLGAQVSIEGTGLGTLTDGDGRFRITEVPAGEQTVVVQLIGYGRATREVDVAAGQLTTVEVQLRSRAIEMEGIVVTGTAIAARRREIGNSIGLVTTEQIEETPAQSLDDVLRGRLPGMTVMGTSGQAGSGSSIVLRGLSSLQARNSPLIYVDGVRIQESSVYEAAGEAQQSATVLNSINPEDIERIEVVKGAAATTLYGTEAGSGVIQIFTKDGAATDGVRWTFSTDQNITSPGHVGPESDPTGLHVNDCTANGPIPSDTTAAPDPGCPASGSWLRDAWQQEYRLSARGGGEDFNFFASGGFEDQQGVVNTPEEFDPQNAQTVTMRANFSFDSWEDVNVRWNNSYTHREIRWFPDGDNAEGLMFNVTFLDEGETPENDDSRVFEMDINQDIDHFTTGTNITWQAMDNLRHRFNAGLDWTNSNQRTERPFGFYNAPEGTRTVDIENSRVITLDYAGSWSLDEILGDFSSELSWGGQFIDREELGLRGDCDDFPTRAGRRLTEDCADITNLNEDRQGFRNGGIFLQERIGWKERVYVTAGARADNHSSFSDDLSLNQKLVVYPKFQATYTVSDETFWPDWWQTLRFRAAWGESGQPPDPAASQLLWQIAGADENEQGFIINDLGNPDIGPERTQEFEAGLDGSLVNGRVSFSATYFDRTTDDGLVNFDLAPSNGVVELFPSNVGNWDGRGVEAQLNVTPVDTRDLSFSIRPQYQFTETIMRNFGPDEDGFFCFGYDNCGQVGERWPAAVGEELLNPDEEGVLPEYADSLTAFGPSRPPHEFSLGADVTFRQRLTLDVFGYGQFGHLLLDDQAQELAGAGLWPGCVDTNTQVNDWVAAGQPEGGLQGLTAGEIARCSEFFADNRDWFEEGDFFRFQSARLSYRLPESWLPTAIRSATVQLQARNLAIFTDFSGVDPDALISPAIEVERVSGYTLPLPAVYGLNVRLTF